ncbi:MAG: sensor histidine kinase [Turicibacter sp.]
MRQKKGVISYVRNRIELWFRQFSIHGRLIITMLLLSILPMLIIGGFGMRLIYDSMEMKYLDYVSLTNEILADNLSIFVQDVESFRSQLLFSSSIRQGLIKEEPLTISERLEFMRDVEKIIMQNYPLLTLASEIAIVNTDKDILYSQGFQYINSDFIMEQIDQLQSNEKISIKKSFYSRDERYLGIFLKINNGNPNYNQGFLFIAIHEEKLQNILKKGMLSGVRNISLLDLDGDIITSIGDDLNEDISPFIHEKYLNAQYAGAETFKTDIINYHFVNYNDWYLVNLTPSSYIFEEAMAIGKFIIFGILCMTIIVSIVSFILWQSIVRPLYRLIKIMKTINDVELMAPQKEDGNDEMTYLYKEFNIMILYIKNLIEDMKEANEKERQLELKMLQAQINPHFLFNTLNSIKWMADMSNVKPISHTIGALSRLLRATIIDTNEKVTIDQELLNVTDYMTIQKNRYGDCFEFVVDIEDGCRNYKIVKFILQPIVENALLHGLNEKDNLMITIKVRDMLNWVYIYVEDNGVGFDVEKVLAAKAIEKLDGKLSSIGLVNVIDRVKLTYGSKGDIKVVSKPNEGTVFILQLPKQL